jgi:hypothetical protein
MRWMLKVVRWDNDDAITHNHPHIVKTITLDTIVAFVTTFGFIGCQGDINAHNDVTTHDDINTDVYLYS